MCDGDGETGGGWWVSYLNKTNFLLLPSLLTGGKRQGPGGRRQGWNSALCSRVRAHCIPFPWIKAGLASIFSSRGGTLLPHRLPHTRCGKLETTLENGSNDMTCGRTCFAGLMPNFAPATATPATTHCFLPASYAPSQAGTDSPPDIYL